MESQNNSGWERWYDLCIAAWEQDLVGTADDILMAKCREEADDAINGMQDMGRELKERLGRTPVRNATGDSAVIAWVLAHIYESYKLSGYYLAGKERELYWAELDRLTKNNPIIEECVTTKPENRPAGDFAIFSGAGKSGPVIGLVVAVGIADEMTDRKYLVVDGIDGRIHYAETGKLTGHDIPEPGMIVALSGGGGKAKMRNAQVEVVSYWPLERLATAEAATWLDQTIIADAKPVIHEKGFGADVSNAVIAREEWLIVNRHARVEQPGTITLKPDMLTELNHRGLKVAAEKLSTQMAMPHVSPFEGMRITGKHVGTIDLPMQRLAVIKGRQEFTLVRWRPELLKMRGKDIEISVRDRTITMALARGRVLDLGLSR